MALKVVLETLDGVDDAIAALYTETGDQFVLDIEGVDDHPEVRSLKRANKANSDKAKDRLEKLTELQDKFAGIPEDFDPETWETLKDGKTDQAAIDAAIAAEKKKLEKVSKQVEQERDEWKTKFDTLFGENRKTQTQTLLSDALAKAGVKDPAFLSATRTMLGPKVSYDDNGEAFVETDMGNLSVEDFVAKWAKSDDGKPFIAQAKGGGTKGGDGMGSGESKSPLASKVAGFSDLPVS